MEMITAEGAEGEAPKRKRGRPRDPQADVRILRAASELILSRGFDAMTVDEVATRARVGKATVYRRWSRKEDLAVAAMEQLYRTELPMPDTGSIREDLLTTYAAVLSFANSGTGARFLHTIVAESVRDSRIAALYRSASENFEERARLVFERAIRRGEIRPDADLDTAMSGLTGLLALCLVSGRPLPRIERAETLVDTLLHGIGS